MKSLSDPWGRLEGWLAEHAPRTRASLLPPVTAERVHDVAARHGRHMPAMVSALYALAGGQRLDVDGAQGVFDGFWFMPLEGVDGLDQALADLRTALDEGAPWATPSLFPFAKDFGGAYLALEAGDEGAACVVEIGDGEARVVAADVGAFLDATAARLERGEVVIDERREERERFVVLFDACRARKAGDAARHSVFEELAIRAAVEDLGQLFGPFDARPAELFGLAARLVSARPFVIEDVALVDAADRALRGTAGHSSGGGAPGVLVFGWDRRPLPAGARLRVTVAAVRRV